jgi:hypothetical protein
MIDHFPIYGTGDLCYVAILIGTKLILNCQVHTSNVLLKKKWIVRESVNFECHCSEKCGLISWKHIKMWLPSKS